jgi:hypothetical protein
MRKKSLRLSQRKIKNQKRLLKLPNKRMRKNLSLQRKLKLLTPLKRGSLKRVHYSHQFHSNLLLRVLI